MLVSQDLLYKRQAQDCVNVPSPLSGPVCYLLAMIIEDKTDEFS